MNWRFELQRQFEVLEHFRKIGGDAYRKADEYCYRFGSHFFALHSIDEAIKIFDDLMNLHP